MVGGWDKKVLKKRNGMSRDMEKCSLSHPGLWLLDGFDVDTDVSSIFIDKKRRWRINHDVWHVYVFRFLVDKVLWYSNAESENISVSFRFVPHSQAFSTFCRGRQSFSRNRWHLEFICLLTFQIEFQVEVEISHIFGEETFPRHYFSIFLSKQMLFKHENRIERNLFFSTFMFKVVGVLNKKGFTFEGLNEVIPLFQSLGLWQVVH